MTNPDARDPKKQLRREMRRLLNTPRQDTGSVFPQLRTVLEARPELQTIALYSPLPGEIDLTPLIVDFPHRRWVFPRVEKSDLVFHHITETERDLEPGAFGIREPRAALPIVPLLEIDAFLCPGLAFDEYGGRLGRGRGFYDRMLEKARAGTWKIGICRNEQIVPDTFAEPHDIAMDQVISG